MGCFGLTVAHAIVKDHGLKTQGRFCTQLDSITSHVYHGETAWCCRLAHIDKGVNICSSVRQYGWEKRPRLRVPCSAASTCGLVLMNAARRFQAIPVSSTCAIQTCCTSTQRARMGCRSCCLVQAYLTPPRGEIKIAYEACGCTFIGSYVWSTYQPLSASLC